REPPVLLHMFDRIQDPHRVLNPLRGAKWTARAMRRPGVDRRALLKEAATEIRIDAGAWREELRPKFRSTRVTASERPDYEWPPRTPTGPGRARPGIASEPELQSAFEAPASTD
ncbi:MAG TPA: hypothetical protein VM347_20265, partial [Nonomuraea sp.]|nr:hypothetical protein [Nonomuraea sp.]